MLKLRKSLENGHMCFSLFLLACKSGLAFFGVQVTPVVNGECGCSGKIYVQGQTE